MALQTAKQSNATTVDQLIHAVERAGYGAKLAG